MFENLTDENILIYALKHYTNNRCIMSEFEVDFNRISYIKRLLKRYRTKKDLNCRLLLNHIIMFYNVFDIECGTRLLFAKIDEEDYTSLKTFLIYLNYIPETGFIQIINGKSVNSNNILIDLNVAKFLKDI